MSLKLKLNINTIDNDFQTTKKSLTNPLILSENYIPLMEGVFHTYPINDVKDFLIRYYGLDNNQVTIVKGENNEEGLSIIIPPSEKALNKIEPSLKLCGYYIAYINKNDNYWTLECEKNKTNNINDNIKDYKKLYHITPHHNVDKIKQMGLCPKTKNKIFNYPDRIYFSLTTQVLGSLKNALIRFEKLNNPNITNIYDYAILEINKEKLPNDIMFYYDINAENCVYTTDNIPPQFIKVVSYI